MADSHDLQTFLLSFIKHFHLFAFYDFIYWHLMCRCLKCEDIVKLELNVNYFGDIHLEVCVTEHPSALVE